MIWSNLVLYSFCKILYGFNLLDSAYMYRRARTGLSVYFGEKKDRYIDSFLILFETNSVRTYTRDTVAPSVFIIHVLNGLWPDTTG